MRIPKYLLALIILIIAGLIGYIVFLKKQTPIAPLANATEITVEKWTLTDMIDVTGNAALANEQKLKFWQNGKVAEILVKSGDNVEKNAVLATLDKREFFQEMSQASNALEKINQDIANEKEKSRGPEARQMAREIESMERKVKLDEEELGKLVRNSPNKSQEKILDINAKKRDLEALKNKFSIDEQDYNKENTNQKELIAAKIRDGRKLIETIIQAGPTELSEMRAAHESLNHYFAFDISNLTSEDIARASYIANNNASRRGQVESAWRELRDLIDGYSRIVQSIDRDSKKSEDALGLTNEQLRIEKKLLEALDNARLAAEATETQENSSFTRADLQKVLSEIWSLRSATQAKINSINENRDNLLVIDSPEKITQKFLAELQAKKIALDKARDDIKRAELTLSQDQSNITIISDNRVIDSSVSKEILDKQSSIQDQKDAILSKKEALEKLQSGKSESLQNLLSQRKNQLSEMEKLRTKEESYEIRAPFSGTIRTIKMQVGDILGSSSQWSTDEKFILLENSELINIKVALNQLDIVKVKLGQKANISFEAVPDANLEGTISEISSTPSADQNSGGMSTYEVVISALRGNYAIYSGMNAMVNISLDSESETLLVPLTAVSEDPANGDKYVNVIDNGKVIKTKVETGKTNKANIQILSGLTEWQKIQLIDFSANTHTAEEFSPNFWF